ncbi:hypothetical protein N9H39_10710 [Gammaproteobacteria bacterium]|nr:hypothetical protein [Gammaproteobacteria bacterium]
MYEGLGQVSVNQALFSHHPKCGGTVKVIACIEDPVVIDKILAHLNVKALPVQAPPLPKCRAPPQAVLID